ncbi:ATP-binding cassette domain-containing protein, partial [candidate division KSB1 bacterium]|nr:ATP-binding cassette domain-containing protein [candidate division KSB1 bacterium]
MNEYDDEITGKAYDARLIRRLFHYLRPYRFKVIIAALLLILHGLSELIAPWLLKIGIDRYIAQKDMHGLTVIAGVIFAVLVAQFFVEYTQYLLTQWIGQHIMYDMRTQIFAHLQKLPLSFFDHNPVGRLVTRTMNDVESLNNLLSNGVVTIIGDIFVLVGIVLAMLLLNWQLALVTLIVLPFIIAITFIFRFKVRKSFRKIRIRLARINSNLRENISGMAVVQVFNREAKNIHKFSELNKDHLNAHLQTIRYFAVFFPTVEILRSVALALILWYGGLQVFSGVLTIGVMVAFIQYLQRFFHPIRDLAEKYNILQQAMASSERIFNLLDTPEQIIQPPNSVQLAPPRGEINFKNVWFAYNEGEYVLRDINLQIKSGEKVAIVGSTGAGKTSLVHLIMRMYEPTRGIIQLDGTDIQTVNLYDLRRRIGLVQQDVFIFSGSVAYNIGLGHPEITQERILR